MEPQSGRGPPLFAPSQLTFKTVLTACAGTTLFTLGAWIVWRARSSIVITIAALLIAVPLNRLVRGLTRHRVPRALAITAVMLGLLCLLGGIVWAILPLAIEQAQRLGAEGPNLLDGLRRSSPYQALDSWFHVDRLAAEALSRFREHPTVLAQKALGFANVLLRSLVALVTVIFLTLFILIYGRNLGRFAIAQALPVHQRHLELGAQRLDQALGGYILGVVTLVAANSAGTMVYLALIGVQFFLPLGILSGLASLVPFIGATAAGTLITIVAAASKGLWYGVATAIYYVVYQQFENHVLAPMVYKRTVELNPLLSILFVLFLGELAGITGAILAVPTLAVAKILLLELLRLRAEQLHLPPPDTRG